MLLKFVATIALAVFLFGKVLRVVVDIHDGEPAYRWAPGAAALFVLILVIFAGIWV